MPILGLPTKQALRTHTRGQCRLIQFSLAQERHRRQDRSGQDPTACNTTARALRRGLAGLGWAPAASHPQVPGRLFTPGLGSGTERVPPNVQSEKGSLPFAILIHRSNSRLSPHEAQSRAVTFRALSPSPSPIAYSPSVSQKVPILSASWSSPGFHVQGSGRGKGG
jgi:hypothetical protein